MLLPRARAPGRWVCWRVTPRTTKRDVRWREKPGPRDPGAWWSPCSGRTGDKLRRRIQRVPATDITTPGADDDIDLTPESGLAVVTPDLSQWRPKLGLAGEGNGGSSLAPDPRAARA